MRTHGAFDALAGAAAGATGQTVLEHASQITRYCVGCRATYRLEPER